MRLVKQAQRVVRVIANKHRRIGIALSTNVGILFDRLEAHLGMSSEREGRIHPSPRWLSMFGPNTYKTGSCTRATFRPAYVSNHRSCSTRRIGH